MPDTTEYQRGYDEGFKAGAAHMRKITTALLNGSESLRTAIASLLAHEEKPDA